MRRGLTCGETDNTLELTMEEILGSHRLTRVQLCPRWTCGMMLQNDLTHWMEAPNSSAQLLGLDIVEVQPGGGQTEMVCWCPEEGQ